MLHRTLFLIAALLAIPVAASAQVDLTAPPSDQPSAGALEGQRDPVTVMFDNFSISLVAAHRCRQPDEKTMTMFMQNLMIVQQVTIKHYREMLPEKSVDEITEMLNTRVQNLDTVITDAIQVNGCTSPEIAKMVDSFDVNARVDFTKKP